MTKKILLILLLVSFLAAGTINAETEGLPEPGMLPGNPFYFFKTLSENVGTFLTFGDVRKADRFVYLAEKRLSEAQALAEKGDSQRAEKATEKYQEHLAKALAKAEEAKVKGKDVDDVLAKVAESTFKHQEVLARVYEKVPEQAKASIEKAMENSAKGYETALNAISDERQEQVRITVEEKKQEMKTKFEELKNKGIPIKVKIKGDEENDSEEEVDSNITTLNARTWKWIKTIYNNDSEIMPNNTEVFTLTFKTDGTFSATTDCNSMSGNYEAQDNKITFKKIAATLMFCESSQEQEFTSMIEEAQSFFFTSQGDLIFDLKFDSGSSTFR